MESSSQQASFGRYLQAIRLEKRISLDQVAEETRIAVRSLEAIDREELQGFPPEAFLKGFLRAYAKAVGADGDEAVRRYDAHRVMTRKTEDAGLATGACPLRLAVETGRRPGAIAHSDRRVDLRLAVVEPAAYRKRNDRRRPRRRFPGTAAGRQRPESAGPPPDPETGAAGRPDEHPDGLRHGEHLALKP